MAVVQDWITDRGSLRCNWIALVPYRTSRKKNIYIYLKGKVNKMIICVCSKKNKPKIKTPVSAQVATNPSGIFSV